jgi:general L-amino acid transport system permease protein
MADTASVKILPPRLGVIAWLRQNLFSSWTNTALSLAALYLLAITIPPVLDWILFAANWTGQSGRACAPDGGGEVGACWPFIKAKWQQIFYGAYPKSELWRVDLAYLLGALGLLAICLPMVPGKGWALLYMFVIFPVAATVLLAGGLLGLVAVETSLWGGMMLTIVVASFGMAVCLPFGVLLALGRRSSMPVVRWLCMIFIEFWRGVPLVTVLFIASVMLPLFLAPGTTIDKLLRAMVCFSLFASAYMAEVVRGGLQSIDDGQYEVAKALGLGYWRTMGLIILPQALTRVIPGIVNSFIAMFKDTTLVLVIGLSDLFTTIHFAAADAKWAAPQTTLTGYVFAAVIFWLFCYAMSLYSRAMERRLGAGDRK